MLNDRFEWINAEPLFRANYSKNIGIEIINTTTNELVEVKTSGIIYSENFDFTPNQFVTLRANGILSQEILSKHQVNSSEDVILIIGIATSTNSFRLFESVIEYNWSPIT
jgi:hypothetical protein